MNELVKQLKVAKDKMEELNALKKEKTDAFNQSIEALLNDAKEQSQIVSELENIVRTKAVDRYKETGEKKMYGGIGIRITKQMDYAESDAFKWAKEHDMALKLDAKAFEKIATVQDMEFVKKSEVPTATIPKEIIIED